VVRSSVPSIGMPTHETISLQNSQVTFGVDCRPRSQSSHPSPLLHREYTGGKQSRGLKAVTHSNRPGLVRHPAEASKQTNLRGRTPIPHPQANAGVEG